MKITKHTLVAAMMAVFGCSVANAQYSNALSGATTLIYSNGFDGSAIVNITNTAADYEAGILGGVTSTNWVDLSGTSDTNAFYANGAVGTPQGSTIVLPFTPQTNHVYVMQASVTLAGNPGSWVAAGYDFYSKIQGSSHNLFNGNGGWDWTLINYSGNVEYFLGQSTGTGITNWTAFTAAAGLTHVLTLILDTTSNENSSNRWIAGGYIDNIPMGTHSFPSTPSIAGIGFGQNAITIGAQSNIKWNYLTLSANQLVLVQQPISANVNDGSGFTNSVVVGGTPPFYYQWYTNGVAIGSATNANLPINPITPGNADSDYYCIITNAYGAVTSTPASLSVYTTPQFLTANPITYTNLMTLFGGTNSDGTNYLGSSPSFSVYAGGLQPIAYFWLTNGVAVGGANGTTFTFTNCQLSSPTNFTCIASNSLGTATNSWMAQYIPTPTAPYPQQIIADGPAGYWRLDEPDDGSGYNDGDICNDFMSGNNGIYTNTELSQPGYYVVTNGVPLTNDPTEMSAAFGPFDQSTSDDANSIGTNVDFSSSTNAEFSVSAWANGTAGGQLNSAEPASGGIVVKGSYGNEEFALDDGGTGNTVRFAIRTAANTLVAASSTVQLGTNNVWYHLVGVCDESNGLVSLYINGLLVAQAAVTPGSGVLPEALAPITIAANPTPVTGAGDHQYNGWLDDVAIFGKALSASQVAQLYAVAGGVNPLTIIAPVPATNVVWRQNTTLTIPAFAIGALPIGYYWTNVTVGGIVLASGSTNKSTLNATLTIASAPPTLSGDVLELVITNATGSTNLYTTVFSYPPPVTIGYTNSILYSNVFNGGTWNLAGTATTLANSLVGGTNSTWVDALGVNDTGTMEGNGIDNTTLGDSWLLPFTPQSGFVYTLTATLTFYGSPGNWTGIGFAQTIPTNAPNGSGRYTDLPVGYDWIILTESSGNVQYFAGPTTTPVTGLTNVTGFFTSGAGTHTVTVALDTTGPQWVQYAFVDGVPAGTNTYTSNPPIGAFGMTQNIMTSPNNIQWDSMSLTAVSPNGFAPYLLTPVPSTNGISLTNTTVTVSATGYGTGPWGYYWINNSTVLASGATNNTAPNVANLSVASSSLSAGQLELVMTNSLGTNITVIPLVSSLNTSPTNIVWSVTNNNLYLSWPNDHTGWTLQAQTNNLSVGISTNWVNVAASSSTNQVVVPINLTNGSVFYRLTY